MDHGTTRERRPRSARRGTSPGSAFLCYSHHDTDFATALEVELTAAGISVWRDAGEIPNGAPWHDAIVDGVRSTDVVVVVSSPDAARSANVAWEIDVAQMLDKPFVVIVARRGAHLPQLGELRFLPASDRFWATIEKALGSLRTRPLL
jgi:hypothetical protein